MEKKKDKKQWQVIEVTADGTSGWWGGAYTIAFIYSSNGNFILKGYIREVEEKLKDMEKGGMRWFGNFTLWSKRSLMQFGALHRNIWKFWNSRVGIFEPNGPEEYIKRRNKWEIRRWSSDNTNSQGDHKVVKLKRLPNKWIPELENL